MKRSTSGSTPADQGRESSDDDLADYVMCWLRRTGPQFATEDALRDALAHHRDLWQRLFELDLDLLGDSSP